MNPYREKAAAVDKGIQYRLLLYNWLYFLIIALVLIVALFMPLVFQLSVTGLSWVQQGNLARNILFLHGHLWPAVLLVFILLSLHSLIISSKIVHPLRRLRSALSVFAAGGRWNPPMFRKGDILSEDFKELVNMLSRVQAKLDRVCSEHEELHRRIQGITARAEGNPLPNDLQVNLLRLNRQSARMKQAFDREKEHAS